MYHVAVCTWVAEEGGTSHSWTPCSTTAAATRTTCFKILTLTGEQGMGNLRAHQAPLYPHPAGTLPEASTGARV